jgi:serine/threonine-protein kinase
MTGTRIGKYELVRRLGGGGMAEVFLARTIGVEGFARPVAIKRVLPSYSANPGFAKMFGNEARLSAGLRHANIVSTLDFDRDADGSLFLVMELVEGKDLDGLLETGPLPWAVTIHVIVEVLRGLGAAHDAVDERGKPLGIVHRDVSPHNVLVSWDGAVKVSDFGIAKAFQVSSATHSGMLKGKASYMSPEQVNASPDLDGRSDLFAVGAMLHEMLTGERLFKGDSIEQVLTHAIRVASHLDRLPWPTQVRADVPPDLAEVAMRLLDVDRDRRFGHARDAMAALKRCRDASMEGQELLAQVMAERFASDAPARTSGVHVAPTRGPQQPTFVTPSPRLEPRTAVLTPGQTPPGYAVARSASMAAPRARRWPFVAIGSVIVAAGAVVAILATSGPNGAPSGPRAAAATPPAASDAAPPAKPDAPLDLAPSAPPADANAGSGAAPRPDDTVPDAAPPPAPGGSAHRRPHPHGAATAGSGSGGSHGIQEIKLGGTK